MRGYFGVGLYNPKHAVNVGGVLRAAYNFGAAFAAIAGRRVTDCADTPQAWRHLPCFKVADLHDVIPHDCVPIAVEFAEGARDLVSYLHPERAFYVFGPEDSSLGKRHLIWCRDVIQIPTPRCLNLATSAGIVFYDRLVKIRQRSHQFDADADPMLFKVG